MKLKNSYIICSTPRSGSTLLCDLLTATGVAGRPNSFFIKNFYSDWALYLNVCVTDWKSDQEFDQAYLDAVLIEGTAQTQVFGQRLQWENLQELSNRLEDFYPARRSDSDRLFAAFGTTHYIYLSRKDKIAQAISLLRAQQSGLWHIHPDGTERERLTPGHTPVYDGKALSKLVTEIKQHDAAWVSWFGRQKIQPFSVTYEALCAAPQSIIADILSSMNLDPIHAHSIQPMTAKLSNNESKQWAKRFREEQSGELI